MAPVNDQHAFDLAFAHHQAGRLREAEEIYRQILAGRPDDAGALHYLGVLAHQTERNDAAVDLIGRAIAARPDYAEAHCNLGNALKETGKLDLAIAACRRAIVISPNYAEAHNGLGNALKDRGELDEAIGAYRRAIALRANYAEAHSNLGNALHERGRFDEAIAASGRAVVLNPNLAEAYNNLGNALKGKGALQRAIAAYGRAIALRPELAQVHSNLGNVLQDEGQLDEAIAAYGRAIELRPELAEAHSNLGNALREKGQLEEAIAAHRRAIALRPDYAEGHLNLAICLLFGDFEEGWVEYEWRSKTRGFWGPDASLSQPVWDGGDLKGRTILLYAEQGFGETIQFVRYVPQVAGRGGRVMVQAQKELIPLLRQLPGAEQWIARGEGLPAFDVQCPLPSLPRIFGTTLQTIPAQEIALRPAGEVAEAWRGRVEGRGAGVRVGLAWAGNPNFIADRTRSMTLDRLGALARAGGEGVTFYSLQKGAAAVQADRPPEGLRLVNLAAELRDFADTAAVMGMMDLVITTDTSVAHLAGAMGRPVWVMLQFMPDWRWLLGREDSPWYPTMRLFRQRSRGDWGGVVSRVAEELGAVVAGGRG